MTLLLGPRVVSKSDAISGPEDPYDLMLAGIVVTCWRHRGTLAKVTYHEAIGDF